jgi:SYP5 family syntaxin
MRDAAWQSRIDELEQLLREAEEKVNERDVTATTTTTLATAAKRRESGRHSSSSSSSSSSNSTSRSSISSISSDIKNNNSRLTAEGRRKLTTFAAKLSELSSALRTKTTTSGEGNQNNAANSAMVMRSRGATIEQLRVRGEAALLKLNATPDTNAPTMTKSSASATTMLPLAEEEEEGDQEELTTLLQFQRQVLQEQDEELTDLSNHVTRTKHIAIAVGEELDLHTRLLDDFDDEVEHTAGNLKRIASSARRLFERIGKSNFSLGCCLAVLVFMLVILIALSILKVEGKFHPVFT